jgi:hypothetical protein
MEIVIDILGFVIGGALVGFAMLVAWESSVMVSEKRARFRAGTHDYYDNPINTSHRPRKGETFDKSKVKYFDGDNT